MNPGYYGNPADSLTPRGSGCQEASYPTQTYQERHRTAIQHSAPDSWSRREELQGIQYQEHTQYGFNHLSQSHLSAGRIPSTGAIYGKVEERTESAYKKDNAYVWHQERVQGVPYSRMGMNLHMSANTQTDTSTRQPPVSKIKQHSTRLYRRGSETHFLQASATSTMIQKIEMNRNVQVSIAEPKTGNRNISIHLGNTLSQDDKKHSGNDNEGGDVSQNVKQEMDKSSESKDNVEEPPVQAKRDLSEMDAGAMIKRLAEITKVPRVEDADRQPLEETFDQFGKSIADILQMHSEILTSCQLLETDQDGHPGGIKIDDKKLDRMTRASQRMFEDVTNLSEEMHQMTEKLPPFYTRYMPYFRNLKVKSGETTSFSHTAAPELAISQHLVRLQEEFLATKRNSTKPGT